MIYTKQQIEQTLIKNKYIVYENKPNIVGVRSADSTTNIFNDTCYVFYKDGDKDVFHYYTITTDPGQTYLQKLINPKGAAILVPEQYVGCWVLGKHRGKQEALIQQGGPVKVYRDINKDNKLDLNDKTIDVGYFGINLHHAGNVFTKLIGPHSAGCQVWAYKAAHEDFIKQMKYLSKKYKFSKFSYTLLREEDITTL